MNKTIINVLFLMCLFTAFSQQDPQYTQYMYNQAVINPAYAGTKDAISFVKLYRNQHWTRPKTHERPKNSVKVENGCYW